MRLGIFLCAMLSASSALPYAALADDPNDPTMDAAAIARDRELIRQMNLDLLAQVQERDKRYQQGWRDYALAKSGQHPDQLAYRQKLADYERARADYDRERAHYSENRRSYDHAMDSWRADVAACRAGNYE